MLKQVMRKGNLPKSMDKEEADSSEESQFPSVLPNARFMNVCVGVIFDVVKWSIRRFRYHSFFSNRPFSSHATVR